MSDPATSAGSAWPPGRVPFWKMNGGGNDFVMIDNRDGIVPEGRAAGFTRAVCDRRRSIGADGVVLLGPPVATDDAMPLDFTWRYLNADGSEGAFCGNGAMCAARLARSLGITATHSRFLTPAGVVMATVGEEPGDQRVALGIADPSPVGDPLRLEIAGHPVTVHPILVGVPHAVAIVDDLERPFPRHGDGPETLIPVGRAVRRHPAVGPAGTNLNVIVVRPDGTLLMRTYERGVEDETLACGSGSVASAVVAAHLGLAPAGTTVMTRGGWPLAVGFAWDAAARRAGSVTLAGRAALVAHGELTTEALDLA